MHLLDKQIHLCKLQVFLVKLMRTFFFTKTYANFWVFSRNFMTASKVLVQRICLWVHYVVVS